MSLALQLQCAGYIFPTELSAESPDSFDSDGAGFRMFRSALTLRATLPNFSEATLEQLANHAGVELPGLRGAEGCDQTGCKVGLTKYHNPAGVIR
jgi:osmotically inducible protein OsmC